MMFRNMKLLLQFTHIDWIWIMNSLFDSLVAPIFAVLLSLSITIIFIGYAMSQFNHQSYTALQQYNNKDKHDVEQQHREFEQLYDLNRSSAY